MNPQAGRNYLSLLAIFILLFFSGVVSFAGPSRTTYQAKIVKPDGYPLEALNVNFKFTILDPTATCILYSETYSSVNMSSSSGLISFSLGSGTKTFPVSATTFEEVFSNITPFLACDSGGPASYSPTASDMRRIVMQFNDGTGWQTLPAMSINAVPYAMYADTATTLAGKTASDFVQVTTIPTCTASEAIRFNGTSFSCIAVGGGGGGGSVTSSTVITALGYTPADGASVTTLTSGLATVSSSVGSANSTIASVSSTVYSVSSTVSVLSNTVSALSSTVNTVSATVATLSGTVNSVSAAVTSLTSTVNSVSSSVVNLTSTVNAVSSSVSSLSNTVNSVSSSVSSLSNTVNSVSSSVASVSATVSTLSGTVSALATSFSTITSSQWVTSGSNISYSTGFVGIGTSSPLSILDVRGGSVASATAINIIAQSSNAGNTAGGGINITAGDGFAATTRSIGGAINIRAGMGAGAGGLTAQMRGGTISMNAGQGASGGGPGGFLNISAGQGGSASGAGGSVSVNGGAATNGIAGNASVNGGNSSEGAGGHVIITGGYAGSSSGTGFYGGQISIVGGQGINSGLGGKVSIIGGLGASGTADIILQSVLGNVGVGETNPTARLNIGAGTSTYAPLKFTPSTLLASPASGAIEYDGSSFYITDSTNTRRAIATVGGAVSATDYSSAISATTNITMTPTNSVIVSSTATSTNAGTGALIVKGGLGVSGSIYSSGTIVTTDNIQGTSITATSGLIAPKIFGSTAAGNNLYLDSTTNAVKGYVLIGNGGSNVGMGTTMPLAKLYVDSDGMSPNIPMAGTVAVFDNESSDMGIALMTSNNHKASYYFGTTSMASRGAITYTMGNTLSQDKLSIDVNFASRLQISSSGTVGIGLPIASSPAAMLQIVNNDSSQVGLLIKDAPAQAAQWLRFNDSNDVTRGYFSPNGGMPTLRLGVTNAIGLTGEYGGIQEIPAGAALSSTGNLDLFNTTGTAGAKVMTGYFNGTNFYSAWEIANVASGYGNLLLMKSGGNVGVGTTNPLFTLDVSGTLRVSNPSGNTQTNVATFTNSTNSAYTTMTSAGSASVVTTWTSGTQILELVPAGTGDGVISAYTGSLKLQTNNRSNVMTLANTGYVGIGTTTPAVQLHVKSATSNTQIRIEGPSSGAQAEYYSIANGISWVTGTGVGQIGSQNFSFYNSTVGANVMTVTPTGNVGIGTVSPSALLHLRNTTTASTAGQETLRISGDMNALVLGSGPRINFENSSGNTLAASVRGYTFGSGLTGLGFDTGYGALTTKMVIDNGGNVGIGMTSPSQRLTVSGAIRSEASAVDTDLARIPSSNEIVLETAGDGLTSSWLWREKWAAGNYGIFHDNAQDYVRFVGSNTARLSIGLSSGNIGIGTSTPTASLNIGGLGAANATALRIDSQDTYYRDIFMSEFNTTSYGGILRYHSGLDLLQLITVEAGVEKYGVAVARATGYVGIGMNSAASYPLDVNGDIRISGTPYRAGGDIAWTVPSDARLKDVVRTFDRGLNEILNIDTIIYRYKKGNVKDIDPTKEYSGVLAQQVQEQIPEAVKVDKDGYLSLNTTPIFWAMLNSIKEIYHKVQDMMKNDQAQDREIASVKEENAAIKAENVKIKQENSEIKAYLCAKDPSAPICK